MRKYTAFLLFLFLFSFWACTDDEQASDKEVTDKHETSPGKPDEQSPETLSIEGSDIWVRNSPTTGDVVMKLNDGNKCIVLEKGKQETINGHTDFWYKIEYEGETGWVFGSQTSKKTGVQAEAKKTGSNTQLQNEISNAVARLHSDYKNINRHFYESQGILFINNPGVYEVVQYTQDLSIMEELLQARPKCNARLQSWPKFSMERSEWLKSGCFIEKVQGEKVFENAGKTMREYDLPISDYTLDKCRDLGKEIRIKVLNTNNNIRYYFGQKNNEWKLIGIDISDFSS